MQAKNAHVHFFLHGSQIQGPAMEFSSLLPILVGALGVLLGLGMAALFPRNEEEADA